MYDLITADLSEEISAELSAGLASESDISSSGASSRQELTPFSWENIKPTFTILWQGLLAIFAVIGIIIAVVWAINFCIARADNAKKGRLRKTKSDGSAAGTDTDADAPTDEEKE